jgi:perosamine synthetase
MYKSLTKAEKWSIIMIKPEIKYGLEISFGTKYGAEEAAAILECLEQNAPSCGKKVKEFEDEFAKFCGVEYALTVTSATTGLFLAGIAAGVEPGDEVITTPISWISTASAFSTLGAKIVFCDVNPRTLNLDPDKLEACITSKTKAIVPVHLYGQCCEMDKIMKIADRHGIVVIEDCAHNPGGEYLGKKSGSIGHMGVFSFHQQKNMSTLGEGGMITTHSKQLFERILSYRSLCCRQYGGSSKYLPIDEEKYPMEKEYWKLQFDDFGYNFRMTDIQAATGLVQLKKLNSFNARRTELSHRLTEKLSGIKGLTLPYADPNGKHVYHIYMIQIEKDFALSKDDFMWEMYTGKGIKVWSNYMPIHMTFPYVNQGHGKGECPVAENAFKKYVSLPMNPRLTKEAIDYMADSIRELAGV